MNIAIVSLDDSDIIKVGGKHIHQILLEKGLVELGHSVYKFYPKKNLSFYFFRSILFVLTKIRIFKKSFTYKWTINKHLKNIQNQFQTNKANIDICFAQDPVSAVAIGRLNNKEGLNLVLTLHGYLAMESVNYGDYEVDDKINVINEALIYEKESLKYLKSLICVDTKISKYIENEFNYSKKIKILKNAIDVSMFGKTSPMQMEKLKLRYNIPIKNKIVLIPRRLVKKNGVEIAIRALSEILLANESNYSFLIAGDGPLLNQLKSLKNKLDIKDENLIFLGSINHSDVIKFYDLSDIVLIPSVISDGVEEATSLSMLEGMAAKKIVIVSNIGGMKEVVTNGKNGFSFMQGDIVSLKNIFLSLKNIDQNKIESIVKEGFSDVFNKHHYRNHTLEYLKI